MSFPHIFFVGDRVSSSSSSSTAHSYSIFLSYTVYPQHIRQENPSLPRFGRPIAAAAFASVFSPALEYVLGDGVDSTAQKALFSFPLIQAAIGGDRGREGCRVEGWVVVTLYLAGEGTPPHPHPVLPILHPTHYSSSCAVGSVGAVVGIRGKEKEKNGEVAKPSFPSLSSLRPERRFSGFWADGGGGGGGGAPKRCMRRRP